MWPSILPSEILDKRLALLRTLLGPGWLGPVWIDGPSAGPGGQSWAAMERSYDRLIRWLLPGLHHLCRIGRGRADDGLPAGTLSDPALPLRDVPVALVHALRAGLLASPAGIETSCHVTAGDLLNGIVPLLAWLYCLNDKRLEAASEGPAPARCLVLLAAVPGAGKSVIASLVEQFSMLLKEYPVVQSTGMDGWHLPNRVIQARTFTDEVGRIVPLATRKGSPESFDVKALIYEMESLVRDPAPARLPLYDRRLHEPVADAALVGAPIVLLEGNYLLLHGQGWERLADLACGAVWLDAPIALARRSILDRHAASARSPEEAESKWAGNDWHNAMVALRSRSFADAVLYLDERRRMRFVHRPGGLAEQGSA